MSTTSLKNTVVALLLCGCISSIQAATITWKVLIGPKNAGTVAWQTSSPSASGSLSASGKITFNAGAFVDLTFNANPGFTLTLVTKNADNITASLDSKHHFRFGPVDSPHTIGVLFSGSGGGTGSVDVPTGAFGFAFPSSSSTLAPVFDISGNYSGVTPTATKRNYNFDVAMDEFGKVSTMGTLTGVTNADGSSLLSADIGAIKTVDNKPTNFFKTKFKGTADGKPVAGSADGSGPVPTTVTNGVAVVAGTGSYKGTLDGVKYANDNVPVQAPLSVVQTKNLSKAWNIQISILNEATGSKSKPVASAQLTLPSGDVISFAKKTAKYSSTKGYSLSFKSGTNISRSPAAKDKSSVQITGMTFSKSGTTWTVTGGTITYKFLGQNGSGNLNEFLKN